MVAPGKTKITRAGNQTKVVKYYGHILLLIRGKTVSQQLVILLSQCTYPIVLAGLCLTVLLPQHRGCLSGHPYMLYPVEKGRGLLYGKQMEGSGYQERV